MLIRSVRCVMFVADEGKKMSKGMSSGQRSSSKVRLLSFSTLFL